MKRWDTYKPIGGAQEISGARERAAAKMGMHEGKLRAHMPVNAQQVKNWFDNRRRMKRWDTYKPIGTLSAAQKKAKEISGARERAAAKMGMHEGKLRAHMPVN